MLPLLIAAITTSGCVDRIAAVSVDPESVQLKTGKKASFAAHVAHSENSSIQWSIDGLAGTIETTGPNTADLVCSNNPGSYVLTATSVGDGTMSGTAVVEISDFNFGAALAVPLAGTDQDIVYGDLAVSGSIVFVAYLNLTAPMTVNANRIDRYHRADLLAYNYTGANPPPPPVPLQPSFSAGFDAVSNKPRIAADGSGNAYWLENPAQGVIGRMDSQGAVRGVDFKLPVDSIAGNACVDLSGLGLTVWVGTDIAADAAGNVYFIADDGLAGGFKLLKLANLFGAQPTVTALGPPLGAAPKIKHLFVDSAGRILNATNNSLKRILANGTADSTFHPPMYTSAIKDVVVDGGGAIFVTTDSLNSTCVDASPIHATVHVLSDLGMEVAAIDQLPGVSGPAQCLQNILGSAVDPVGNLFVLDDVSVGNSPPSGFADAAHLLVIFPDAAH